MRTRTTYRWRHETTPAQNNTKKRRWMYSHKIDDKLYLNYADLTQQKRTSEPKPASVNWIAVIDCSGSMHIELGKLRHGLKQKLPTLLREGDTLTLIWFSGRGQYGVLLEGAGVPTLRDLARVTQVIDRWLQPQGLTGFKEPIEEVGAVIQRVQAQNGDPFGLLFMSDGMDNQWSKNDVLGVVRRVAPQLVSSSFVEYGWYADRPMLTAMAQAAGGQLLHADDFAQYEPIFAQTLSKRVGTGVRRSASVHKDALGGFVFECDRDGELVTHDASTGAVLVSEEARTLWWLSEAPHGMVRPGDEPEAIAGAVYAAMSLFAARMQTDVVLRLLKSTGDIRFIKQFANCFGKQAYSAFMEATKAAAFRGSLRLAEGFDPNLVPPDDAFTVFDVLRVLAEDEHTKLILDDESFDYHRITRAQLDADEHLSAAERGQVDKITSAMTKEKNVAKLKALQDRLAQITDRKRTALKFVADVQTDGHDLSSLTFNEKSPNISVLIRKTGRVDLRERRDGAMESSGEALRKIPDAIDTFIWRNYAVVAHGILHVESLPVDVSREVYRKLVAAGVRMADNERGVTCIDLTSLPILNRRMVTSASLRETAQLAYDTLAARAAQKVYKDYAKERYPDEKIATFAATYGADAADWLRENGITEHGGFHPPRVQAESADFITGKELTIKLRGYSTLPPVEKVKEKARKGGKLNGPEALMAQAILEVETFFAGNPKKLHRAWLTGKERMNQAVVRSLAHRMSQIVFGIVVGQTWFSDCPTLDDKTVTLDNGVVATAEMEEVEIKL
jgi:hypothetical protein